ncbi:MAG: amino acid permease [Planctomycetia bacterium]|nr:amino acid permease [Planctomycetia bacterium]
MWKQLWAKKDLSILLKEMESQDRLHRVLGPTALTSLGVGAIIGTGIFVLVGKAAAQQTGPALMLSFIASAFACVFAALCYAEFASMAPVAGSAYTYSYATMGELFAWIIGWDLILEYAVASSAVAHAWSDYVEKFIVIVAPDTWVPSLHTFFERWGNSPIGFNPKTNTFFASGGIIDLPAILITAIVTVVLVIGIKESARFNTLMVLLKVGVVLFVIGVGVFFIDPANWTNNFAPFGYGGITMPWEEHSSHPVGMLAGAATIFFAFIGFDSISTHSEEAKNPQRDVPIAIISSLVICTILYVLVAAVLTGMVPYDQIAVEAPVASAFTGRDMNFAAGLISLGAVAGMTSVLLVMLLSQPRVLLAMARDGLLPQKFFGAVHEKFRTPYKSTILTGFFVAAASSLLPLDVLADMTNIGTLLAFVMVCAAVLIMRKTNPDAHRPFRAPLGPVVPIMGIITCLILMLSLGTHNWMRLAIWLAVGMVIYFCYGKRHSHLGRELANEITHHGLTPTDPTPPRV